MVAIDTSDLERALRIARMTAKCDCQEKGGDVKNHFATILCDSHDRLQQENAELREALEGAMRIKDLWLPQGAFSDSPPENYQEIEALHLMAKSFEKLLNKND